MLEIVTYTLVAMATCVGDSDIYIGCHGYLWLETVTYIHWLPWLPVLEIVTYTLVAMATCVGDSDIYIGCHGYLCWR